MACTNVPPVCAQLAYNASPKDAECWPHNSRDEPQFIDHFKPAMWCEIQQSSEDTTEIAEEPQHPRAIVHWPIVIDFRRLMSQMASTRTRVWEDKWEKVEQEERKRLQLQFLQELQELQEKQVRDNVCGHHATESQSKVVKG